MSDYKYQRGDDQSLVINAVSGLETEESEEQEEQEFETAFLPAGKGLEEVWPRTVEQGRAQVLEAQVLWTRYHIPRIVKWLHDHGKDPYERWIAGFLVDVERLVENLAIRAEIAEPDDNE